MSKHFRIVMAFVQSVLFMADEQSPVPESQDPATLSAYSFEHLLGSGSVGAVYAAKVKSNGRSVAIKEIDLTTTAGDQYAVQSFYNELDILDILHHPNIVSTYEVFQTDSRLYFVMDLCSNVDLYEFACRDAKPVEEPLAVKFVSELSEAVAFCHSLDIVHSDIKCENVFLDGRFNVKLGDFSSATFSEKGESLNTRTGTTIFTCPEALEGSPYDGRKNDVWAIGLVMYILVCKSHPYNSDIKDGILQKIHTPLSFPSQVSQTCREFILSLLKVKPSERPYISQVLSHPFLSQFTAFEIGAATFAVVSSVDCQNEDVVEDLFSSTVSLPCTFPAEIPSLQEKSHSC